MSSEKSLRTRAMSGTNEMNSLKHLAAVLQVGSNATGHYTIKRGLTALKKHVLS